MAACACMMAWLPLQALSLAGGVVLCLCLEGRAGARLAAGAMALAAVIALVNPLLNTAGDDVLCRVLGRPYTAEALMLGASAGLMASSLLLWLACLGFAVGSDRMTSLMARQLPRIGLACGLAMQMVPRFARDARRVRQAREGAGLVAPAASGGSAFGRWRAAAREGALGLAAVVGGGLEGAMATAASMEARGFGSGARTSIDSRPLSAADRAFAGALVGLAAASAVGGLIWAASPGEGAACAALFVFYGLLCLLGPIVAIGGELRWLLSRRSI